MFFSDFSTSLHMNILEKLCVWNAPYICSTCRICEGFCIFNETKPDSRSGEVNQPSYTGMILSRAALMIYTRWTHNHECIVKRKVTDTKRAVQYRSANFESLLPNNERWLRKTTIMRFMTFRRISNTRTVSNWYTFFETTFQIQTHDNVTRQHEHSNSVKFRIILHLYARRNYSEEGGFKVSRSECLHHIHSIYSLYRLYRVTLKPTALETHHFAGADVNGRK